MAACVRRWQTRMNDDERARSLITEVLEHHEACGSGCSCGHTADPWSTHLALILLESLKRERIVVGRRRAL